MTPPFPNGAPQSSLAVLAYMLTGEREIPTQDDLFSSKFSPAPFPHFTVNGQCLSVNSSLHHSHSTGQLVSKKTPLIKQYKQTHTLTCQITVHSVPVVEQRKEFFLNFLFLAMSQDLICFLCSIFSSFVFLKNTFTAMTKSGLSHFFKNGMLKKAFIDLLMYFCLSAPRYTTEGKANRHKE